MIKKGHVTFLCQRKKSSIKTHLSPDWLENSSHEKDVRLNYEVTEVNLNATSNSNTLQVSVDTETPALTMCVFDLR